MCGIFGKLYFGKKEQNSDDVTSSLQSLELLRHRGPDHIGHFVDSHMFLGATRLAIVDRSDNGNMPISNDDSSIIGVLNGEIYNFRELKKSLSDKYKFRSNTDTEVLIHLYEKMGLSFLKELKGMFALAIWDKKRQSLLIARDRLGKKPIVYSLSNSSFIFASEIKSIVHNSDINKDLNTDALNLFFDLNYIPAPFTIYKNIYKLLPGSFMTVDLTGKSNILNYWEVEAKEHDSHPYLERKMNVFGQIKEAVKSRIPEECDFGIHLSGGLDSSLVTAITSQLVSKQLNTFSVGYQNNAQNESSFSKLISKQFHTNHHEYILNESVIRDIPMASKSFDEPFADPSLLPTWKLCKESSKNARVVLNGDGGDEFFGGYERYRQFYWNKIPFIKQLALLYPPHLIPHTKLDAFITALQTNSDFEFYISRVNSFSKENSDRFFGRNTKSSVPKEFIKYWKSEYNDNERPFYLDIATYLPYDLLTKTDTIGMNFGQEIRSPLLDDDLFQTAMRLPLNDKLNAFDTKILLKDIAALLLPKQVVARKKQGFIFPFEWLYTKENLSFIHDIVFTHSRLFDFVPKEGVISLFEQKGYQNMQRLWQIINLQLWFLK